MRGMFYFMFFALYVLFYFICFIFILCFEMQAHLKTERCREWVHTCSDLSDRRWTPKATMLSQMYIKSVTGFQRTCMYKIYIHTNIMYKNEDIRLDCLAKTQDVTWGKTGCNQVKSLAGHFSIMLKKNTAEDDLACKEFLEELRLLLTHQVLLGPDT